MKKQRTYSGWKQAVKRAYPMATFYGDKDICGATHEGKQVAEWDGCEGEVN